jgi:ADP-ribosylglycohydrolase
LNSNDNYRGGFGDPSNNDGADTDSPTPCVLTDRATGVVVCSAAGDALGAGYEFGAAFGEEIPVLMAGGGGFGWAPGEWTDDTQLALVILQALFEGDSLPDGYEIAGIEKGFRDWFGSGPADVGIQTSGVLSSQGSLADNAFEYCQNKVPVPAGNGSLMRTGPIALAYPENPQAIAALAKSVSELTHAAEDCVDACVLWSVAIDYTLHNAPGSATPWDWAEPLLDAVEYLPTAKRQQRWVHLIEEATTADPRDFTNNGWVVHAFQAALAAICSTPVLDGPCHATHLQRVLEKVVRAGGDTDTVAAIAGALLGARWGATALPFQWRRKLHGHRIYSEEVRHCADLERLARGVYLSGDPTNPWPDRETWLPYYKQTFGDYPSRLEISGIEFGNVGALVGAVADGADTVVSLCRMGTNEVPLGVEHHVLGFIDSNAADNPNLPLLLKELVEALEQYLLEDRKVFVHCVAAANRTPTSAAAWLVHLQELEAKEALISAGQQLGTWYDGPKAFQAAAVMALQEYELREGGPL